MVYKWYDEKILKYQHVLRAQSFHFYCNGSSLIWVHGSFWTHSKWQSRIRIVKYNGRHVTLSIRSYAHLWQALGEEVFFVPYLSSNHKRGTFSLLDWKSVVFDVVLNFLIKPLFEGWLTYYFLYMNYKYDKCHIFSIIIETYFRSLCYKLWTSSYKEVKSIKVHLHTGVMNEGVDVVSPIHSRNSNESHLTLRRGTIDLLVCWSRR